MSRPENEVLALSMGAGRRAVWQVWILLLVCLIATALAVYYTKSTMDVATEREFDFACNEILNKVMDRMNAHEQILRSGAAFYEHQGGVTRQEWHRFTDRQKVEQQLPGIQGIGFSLLIPREKLATHVQEIRAEGFPAYQVRPEGERETYSSIIYLEPFTNRNLRAFGYDMLSEPIRREAMDRARDHNTAALSGKVVLVQETNQDIQAGTLMYLPVYRTGIPCETVAQRRAALLGWVYSPYRMTDLMRGIMGGWDLANERRIHLEVFDGEQAIPQALLYDSQSTGKRPTESAWHLSLQSRFVSAGRPWTLRFTRTGSQASARDYGKVWLVLAGGTSISLLLAGLFLNLFRTRSRAWQMARLLTTELRENEESLRQVSERLKLAANAGGVGIWDYDVVHNRLVWDDQMFHHYGITRDQFGGAYEAWQAGVHPEDRQRGDDEIQLALQGRNKFDTEFRVIWPDGSIHNIRALALVQRDASGQPLRMIGTNWDITELRAAENSAMEAHRKLLLAREEERRRIAEELHEVICQDIVLMRMTLRRYAQNAGRAGSPDLAATLDTAAETCKELVAKTRDICYSLYPPLLDTLGLVAAVRGLDKLGRQAHTVIEVQFGPGVDTLRLPRVVEIALYRVAQEAVTNALRHAQPSYLCVTMEHSACGTSLRVTDNGNGFSPAQVTTGLGLTVMREHILAVGGTLQITSEPGETVVTAFVPAGAEGLR